MTLKKIEAVFPKERLDAVFNALTEIDISGFTYGVRTKTSLATKTGYSFATGSKFALIDKLGTVSAWTKTGSEYAQLLSASDSTYTSRLHRHRGIGQYHQAKGMQERTAGAVLGRWQAPSSARRWPALRSGCVIVGGMTESLRSIPRAEGILLLTSLCDLWLMRSQQLGGPRCPCAR